MHPLHNTTKYSIKFSYPQLCVIILFAFYFSLTEAIVHAANKHGVKYLVVQQYNVSS